MADRRPLTPEDVVSFTSVTEAQITPDGALVAFVISNPHKTSTTPATSHVWTVTTDGGAPSQFTSGPRTDETPRWSPDGQTMAFLSDRATEGDLQVYLMPRAGGEAKQITDVKGIFGASRSVTPMAWSPNGTRIAFLRKEQDSDEQRGRKKEGSTPSSSSGTPGSRSYGWSTSIPARRSGPPRRVSRYGSSRGPRTARSSS